MQWWELVLIAAAAYVAVAALVRLMRHRRDEMLVEMHRQVELEEQQAAANKAQAESSEQATRDSS